MNTREMGLLARQVQTLTDQVAALRDEVDRMRDEVGLEASLLRQDVAAKLGNLTDVLATRHDLVQLLRKLHRQLVSLRQDNHEAHRRIVGLLDWPAPPDRVPTSHDWAELRAMDPEPRPSEDEASSSEGESESAQEPANAPVTPDGGGGPPAKAAPPAGAPRETRVLELPGAPFPGVPDAQWRDP